MDSISKLKTLNSILDMTVELLSTKNHDPAEPSVTQERTENHVPSTLNKDHLMKELLHITSEKVGSSRVDL